MTEHVCLRRTHVGTTCAGARCRQLQDVAQMQVGGKRRRRDVNQVRRSSSSSSHKYSMRFWLLGSFVSICVRHSRLLLLCASRGRRGVWCRYDCSAACRHAINVVTASMIHAVWSNHASANNHTRCEKLAQQNYRLCQSRHDHKPGQKFLTAAPFDQRMGKLWSKILLLV